MEARTLNVSQFVCSDGMRWCYVDWIIYGFYFFVEIFSLKVYFFKLKRICVLLRPWDFFFNPEGILFLFVVSVFADTFLSWHFQTIFELWPTFNIWIFYLFCSYWPTFSPNSNLSHTKMIFQPQTIKTVFKQNQTFKTYFGAWCQQNSLCHI